ncbi:hypothetical protein GWK47_005239 [Chionoecetes opilio]|uniref:Uncharacterized protein n=1 Tax=Chionoecetes opilio TaxID=41210 RepID=A0A8J5CXC5_CHIOP|nr:hypothetical protein GWK47_005239 [Chionoecetes opilio]
MEKLTHPIDVTAHELFLVLSSLDNSVLCCRSHIWCTMTDSWSQERNHRQNHSQFVQRPMLLNTFKCPVCVEVRAGMVQLFAGFVYPLLLAPTAAMQASYSIFAVRLYTYPVPDARNPLNVVREVFKVTKPILPRFYLLAGLQVVGGVAWAHWELHNLFTVSSKTGEMEKAIKEHRNSKLKPV